MFQITGNCASSVKQSSSPENRKHNNYLETSETSQHYVRWLSCEIGTTCTAGSLGRAWLCVVVTGVVVRGRSWSCAF